MVQFSGYGLIIVVIDYFGGLFLLSKFSPYLFKTEKWQYIALLLGLPNRMYSIAKKQSFLLNIIKAFCKPITKKTVLILQNIRKIKISEGKT